MSQATEASEASSANDQMQTELELSANIQLQTEHANGQLNLTTTANGRIKLAKGHNKRQIELAKRQTKHAKGQIEHNNDNMSTSVEWQVKWQIVQAKKQIQQADEKYESIYWPKNLIEIIKKVMNVPCKTPHPPEFICELSEAAAAHNWEILKKCNNDLANPLIANENTPLGYRSEF